MFPVYGSCVLFGIYLLYRFLPNDYLNFLFSIHFTIMGVFCLANLLELPLSKLCPESWNESIVLKVNKTLNLKIWKKKFDFSVNYLEAVAISISLFPTIIYVLTKGNNAENWLYNNIFGIAFSIIGIE